MAFEIHKDRPIPAQLMGRLGKYPFKDMEVGDSFDVPLSDLTGCRASSYFWSNKLDRKYVVRKTPEGPYVCWRVE